MDAAIAEIAKAQHGVISLTQLTGIGLSASAVRSRVQAGKLHRLHRGVYAVGHELVPWRGRYMAAVLACEPDAYASHTTAARLHGLRDGSGGLHVTVVARRVRVPGVAVHQTRSLAPQDVTAIDGIPCTSIARTILDAAGQTDDRGVERMIDNAERHRTYDLRAIQGVLSRAHGRSGASRVARAVGKGADPARTRNDMEERFLAICERAGVPRPHVNMPIALGKGRFVEVDFAWPEQKLIVETDGWATHGTRRAFVGDRRRDRRLALEWRVVRFTWFEIEHEPERVAADLLAHLA
ncbi:MAG: type IV toxin-antitoxin system AbiEi family antitoxin domain-containing protein [Actinomycetota bacterium]|nr:type IV toxin-antitoxin system AbiEi family antitoxin domain-containing protein [Actinomycetota bacterium]